MKATKFGATNEFIDIEVDHVLMSDSGDSVDLLPKGFRGERNRTRLWTKEW